MPPFSQAHLQRLYRPVTIGFIMVVVGTFLSVIYITLSKTVITVTPLRQPVTAAFDVTVGPQAEHDHDLVGSVAVTPQSDTVTAAVSTNGTTTVPAHAHGTITIENHTARVQPLSAGTRLQSDGGVIVRTQKRLDVPAGGSVTAEVVADPVGADGNLPAGRLIIVALHLSSQDKIFGQITTPLTGGLGQAAGTLSLDDLTKASDQAQAKIADSFGQSTRGLFKALLPVSVSSQPAASVPSDTYQVTVAANGVVVTYEPSDLEKIMTQELSQTLTDDQVLRTMDQPIINAGDQPTKDSIVLHIKAKGSALIKPSSPLLAPATLVNLDRTAIQSKLLGSRLVKTAGVRFSPWWRTSTAGRPESITVLVKPAVQ
ncbi:MAG: baseplate J/gp47 family protein [Candidatus Kerfeldbacteria bacterium]|nr:baseplate J/gp47 family protein [Candidatus Kerfeldbacteria bacterium]